MLNEMVLKLFLYYFLINTCTFTVKLYYMTKKLSRLLLIIDVSPSSFDNDINMVFAIKYIAYIKYCIDYP